VGEAQISFASAEDVIGGTRSIACEKRNRLLIRLTNTAEDVGLANDHAGLMLEPFAPTEYATGYLKLHEESSETSPALTFVVYRVLSSHRSTHDYHLPLHQTSVSYFAVDLFN
jgi:hypothetical protein